MTTHDKQASDVNASTPEATAHLPGFRGIEHFAIAVPDLDEATDFFRDVFGCEVFYTMGPWKDDTGDWLSSNFDIHPRTEVKGLRLLRSPFLNIELFESTSPDQVKRWPKMQDYGGHHLGVYVDDMNAALDYLKTKNVTILGGPKDMMQSEAGEGAYFCHVKTSFGFYFELLTYPNGRAYEKEYTRRLWHPAKPDIPQKQ